jgi:hypothetical protein
MVNTTLFAKKSSKPVKSKENKNKKKFKRFFEVIAKFNCDLLTLSIVDLERMKVEFPEVFRDLVEDAKL